MTRILAPWNGTTSLAMPTAAMTVAQRNRYVTYAANSFGQVCLGNLRLVAQCFGFVGGYYGEGTLLVRAAGEQRLRLIQGSVASDTCVVGSQYLSSVSGNGCVMLIDILKAFRDGVITDPAVVEIAAGGYYSYYPCGTPNQILVQWGWGVVGGSYISLGQNPLLNCSQNRACDQPALWSLTIHADGRID